MSGFKGKIEDIWHIPDKGVVLHLNQVEGTPEVGMQVSVAGQTAKIIELGKNSTDGKTISDRSCLTGQPTSGYGAILTDLDRSSLDLDHVHGTWIAAEGR
ncbi:hypothetical protein [Shimia abyssi]|uniref:Uncharacterized protein n=1 Tax=Shimia abyssi TaxID=1662395 RepID=A0A2P8FJM6_9RHOB|nr:hypothetical protein [Shimia abyssi]PSL21869.1 hypothetical protein CLV88_101293 [Shimia abyssi]